MCCFLKSHARFIYAQYNQYVSHVLNLTIPVIIFFLSVATILLSIVSQLVCDVIFDIDIFKPALKVATVAIAVFVVDVLFMFAAAILQLLTR